jgi:hypothetical protein
MVPPMCRVRAVAVRIAGATLALTLPLAGCADWPEPVDPAREAAGRAGIVVPDAAPRLAPLPDLLAAADPDTAALDAERRVLRARAAALRARAAQVGADP